MVVIDPEKLKEAAPRLLEALLRAYFFNEDDCICTEALKAIGLDTYEKINEAAREMGIIL